MKKTTINKTPLKDCFGCGPKPMTTDNFRIITRGPKAGGYFRLCRVCERKYNQIRRTGPKTLEEKSKRLVQLTANGKLSSDELYKQLVEVGNEEDSARKIVDLVRQLYKLGEMQYGT